MMVTGIVTAFIAGMTLATMNYIALWVTVKRLLGARRPGFLAMASYLMRTAFIIAGFYLVTKGDLARLSSCVIGFLIVRVIAMKSVSPAGNSGRGIK